MKRIQLAFLCCLASACSTETTVASEAPSLSKAIGLAGGFIQGEIGTPFEGVRLEIPDLGLEAPTTITLIPVVPSDPLPAAAESIGPMFRIEPAGLVLRQPATLVLPVDVRAARLFGQDFRTVKVWMVGPDAEWKRHDAVDSDNGDGITGQVSIAIESLGMAGAGVSVAEAAPCEAPCETLTGVALTLDAEVFADRITTSGSDVVVLSAEAVPSGTLLRAITTSKAATTPKASGELVIPSSSALWPNRGIAAVEGTTFVGLDGGVARLPMGDGGSVIAGDTLGVCNGGDKVAWIVARDGKLTVEWLDSAGATVGSPIETDIEAVGPVACASSSDQLVIGAYNRVLTVSLGAEPALVDDMALASATAIDFVSTNGLTVDRKGQLHGPDGLVLAGVGQVSWLVGAGKEAVAMTMGAGSVVQVVSTAAAPRPGAEPPFEASELTKWDLGLGTEVPRAMVQATDGTLYVLDRTGSVRAYDSP